MPEEIYRNKQENRPEIENFSWVKNIPRFAYEEDFHVAEIIWVYGQMGLPQTYLFNELVADKIDKSNRGKIYSAILHAAEIVDNINGDWDQAYTRVKQITDALANANSDLTKYTSPEELAILTRLFGPNNSPKEPVIHLPHSPICGSSIPSLNIEKPSLELIKKIDATIIPTNMAIFNLIYVNGSDLLTQMVSSDGAPQNVQEYTASSIKRALMLSKIALLRNCRIVGATWGSLQENIDSLYLEPRNLLDRFFEPLKILLV